MQDEFTLVSFSSVGCCTSKPQIDFSPVSQTIFPVLVIVSYHLTRTSTSEYGFSGDFMHCWKRYVLLSSIPGRYTHPIFLASFTVIGFCELFALCSLFCPWIIFKLCTCQMSPQNSRYKSSLSLSTNSNPSPGSQHKSTSGIKPWLYVSTYTTFTHTNSLIGVWVRRDGRNHCGGRFDHFDDVLGPLSQEDWDREVSLLWHLGHWSSSRSCTELIP